MSIMLMSQVWAKAPFEKTTLLVLLALADQARDDGTCWPAVSTVAKKARCTDRYCRVILTQLEEAGWLARTHRTGESNRYKVVIPTENISSENISGLSQAAGDPCTGAQDSPELGLRETIIEPSDEPSIVSLANARATRTPKTKKATTWPVSFCITAEMWKWATANANGIDVQHETLKFENYHKSKGSTFKDWEAAWRNWMLNAVKYLMSSNARTLHALPLPPTTARSFEDTYAQASARSGPFQSKLGINYDEPES